VMSMEAPNQTHAEAVAALRMQILKLQESGVIDGSQSELYRNHLLELMKEAERRRETAEKRARDWLEKYHFALGQREAFTALRSLIENLMNAHIARAERVAEEELEEVEESLDRIGRFLCDQCSRSFTTARGLSSHKRFCRTSDNVIEEVSDE